MSESSVAIL